MAGWPRPQPRWPLLRPPLRPALLQYARRSARHLRAGPGAFPVILHATVALPWATAPPRSPIKDGQHPHSHPLTALHSVLLISPPRAPLAHPFPYRMQLECTLDLDLQSDLQRSVRCMERHDNESLDSGTRSLVQVRGCG